MSPLNRWKSKFQIKNGTWVFVPEADAIARGEQIKKYIEERWSPPHYFYHLKKGEHIRALHKHKKHKYFVHSDIKNFFGQINKSRVTRCLKAMAPYTLAREIASDSLVLLPKSNPPQHILPFGFVQSPIIASLCLSQSALGTYLAGLSRAKGISLSVYMDDIIVSGNDEDELANIVDAMSRMAQRSGFPLNEAKQEGPDSTVNAFNVILTKDDLTINPERFRELAYVFSFSLNENQRQGILQYIASVNLRQVKSLTIE